ncbi:S24 family peptidase [Radicibacter daui]|uniref:S24 family peptidase n=1 Tax=Radicibacter daui TaxID=3064829 RepID=UPI004046D943
MLRHADIWRAIDRLAEKYGYSASGLARRAGLDPTTFNPSKRISGGGKERWPSTESVSKVLEATGASLGEFVELAGQAPAVQAVRRIPVIGYAQAGSEGFFDDSGYPVGQGWDEVMFPDIAGQKIYALEVTGNSMEPVYRDGDRIIVSPEESIRRGDRVVVRTRGGEVMAKQISVKTDSRVELASLNPDFPPRSFHPSEISWMARILWASQ